MDGNLIWIMTMGIVILIAVFNIAINNLRSDIGRLNRNLEKIADALGIADINEIPEDVSEEIKGLVTKGKKIEAIKKYRMITGIGLKEAKEYIDNLEKVLR